MLSGLDNKGSSLQNIIEKISGQSIAYYDALLTLTLKTPTSLEAEWLIRNSCQQQLNQTYGSNFLETNQAILRIFHLNATPQPYVEDREIQITNNKIEIQELTPGETLNAQIGCLDDAGKFILLAQSNDLQVPPKN